jgi:translation initiation factor 4G
MYYMLLDTVELRRKRWDSKDNNKGPKTISEIREEAQAAEIERQKAARAGGRPQAGRGDARSFSGNMGGPPPDYHRNQVGIDDLKKLTRGARTNPSSGASLGPSSMLSSSRSGSRRGLGPPRADDSGPSSRTGTPPVKEKESAASVNAYR